MMKEIYFAKKADALNVTSLETWQESARCALLKQKLARGQKLQNLFFPQLP
jgi:hypothetical protein